jgi:hypothetical protein
LGGPTGEYDAGRVTHPPCYQEIAGILRGLTIRLDNRPSATDLILITEFLDANELGLAVDQFADGPCEDEQPVAADALPSCDSLKRSP